MKAIRKNKSSRMNSPEDRSDAAAGFNRIQGMTIRNRTKSMPFPEVWGYIRPKRAENSFECHHCAQSFTTVEQLRQHQADCSSDEVVNDPL